jgi:hypothetical protein
MNLKHFPTYEKNPFLQNLRTPLVPKTHTYVGQNRIVVDMITCEVDDGTAVAARTKYIDGEDFVKIYTKEMRILFELSRPTQTMFSYMLSKVGYDDKIIFSMVDYQRETKYSRTTVFRSLKDLIIKEFISRHMGFVYWINPKLFFKGDRLMILRDYRMTKQQAIVNSNQLSLFKEEAKQGIKEVELENQHLL